MKLTNDGIVFSSGNTLYANCGIIGLDPGLEIFEGYDGPVYGPESENNCDINKQDALELADHMIARWTLYKAKVEALPC